MHTFILETPSVLEPLLMFCKNAIGMRDTRSCTIALRIFRTTIPHFREKSPIRDFVSFDVLRATITSLHEPYFSDIQKDLASLIAQIIHLDRETSRSVILSLPGLGSQPERVERALEKIVQCASERQTRAIVLDLLRDVRGVSIHEQGKIEMPKPKKRSTMQEQYMSVDEQPKIVRGGSPDLAGVADMFE